MVYRAAVLTRMAQKWVTEVRILHPPLEAVDVNSTFLRGFSLDGRAEV